MVTAIEMKDNGINNNENGNNNDGEDMHMYKHR